MKMFEPSRKVAVIKRKNHTVVMTELCMQSSSFSLTIGSN